MNRSQTYNLIISFMRREQEGQGANEISDSFFKVSTTNNELATARSLRQFALEKGYLKHSSASEPLN